MTERILRAVIVKTQKRPMGETLSMRFASADAEDIGIKF
jgi:hypothetical protein